MRVLAISLKRPGHVLHTLVDWWKAYGYDVEDVRLESSYKEQLVDSWEPRGPFDVAITAEPAVALRLLCRYPRPYKKVIFWRIDYRPYKYWHLAQVVDFLCRRADEVWSIIPYCRSTDRYMPALLQPADLIQEGWKRLPRVVWMGPDLDGGLTFAAKAVERIPGVDLARTSWESRKRALSEEELRILLGTSRVGLAIYNPSLPAKRYSEPARVKKFLAAGVPVVMTASFPLARHVVDLGAGVLVDYTVDSISQGICRCLANFNVMSQQATKLASQYVVTERWGKL